MENTKLPQCPKCGRAENLVLVHGKDMAEDVIECPCGWEYPRFPWEPNRTYAIGYAHACGYTD